VNCRGRRTVGRVRRRFFESGLENAVYGYAAPGAPRLLSESDEARIVALACSDPPEGRSRWTTELPAVEAIRRRHVERVGRETVHLVLKHHGLKPWREKRNFRSRTLGLSRMQVDTSVAEADVGRLEAGMTARFTADAYPSETFGGRIRPVRNAAPISARCSKDPSGSRRR
jgi:multidrug efflux pump subunit AcrA (membrane-fusion protein)